MHLSKPEIERCYFDDRFDPAMSVMELCWDPDCHPVMERQWCLPDGVILKGPAPDVFGISVYRTGDDAYQMRMLWNRLSLSWDGLSRAEIMATTLPALLQVLGTDVWYLLNQPLPLAA